MKHPHQSDGRWIYNYLCNQCLSPPWIVSSSHEIFLGKEQWNKKYFEGSSWSWSYGSLIYNYLCNQCTSPLTLWVWTPLRRGVLDTKLCDTVCQWIATGRWFSPDTPVSSTNKTDRRDISEILLKVVLNMITLTLTQVYPYETSNWPMINVFYQYCIRWYYILNQQYITIITIGYIRLLYV